MSGDVIGLNRNIELIEVLEDMLHKAKTGELQGMVAFINTDFMSTDIEVGGVVDFPELIFAMESYKVDLLTVDNYDD